MSRAMRHGDRELTVEETDRLDLGPSAARARGAGVRPVPAPDVRSPSAAQHSAPGARGRAGEPDWGARAGVGEVPVNGRPGIECSEGPRLEDRAGPRWGAAELGREALAYADTLHNLARYLTGNATDAEDLVQETYARALRAAVQFTPGTNLKAWLFRILRNTFVSAYRRQRHNPVVGGLDTVKPANEVANDAWFQNDIDLERLRRVVGEEIEAAVMSLSEEARTVILLDLEGLTDGEIADVVGCAVGTVKSRLARARAALREQLRAYGKGGTSERASPPTPPGVHGVPGDRG
jgi:RNA polymerase sigma-70 factor (ECF subfamily)